MTLQWASMEGGRLVLLNTLTGLSTLVNSATPQGSFAQTECNTPPLWSPIGAEKSEIVANSSPLQLTLLSPYSKEVTDKNLHITNLEWDAKSQAGKQQ